jgi:hypothetical protein
MLNKKIVFRLEDAINFDFFPLVGVVTVPDSPLVGVVTVPD